MVSVLPSAGLNGYPMKAKTIKRHVVILDEYEARLIYYVLRHLEKRDFDGIDAVGIDKNRLRELKECFQELLSESPHSRSTPSDRTKTTFT